MKLTEDAVRAIKTDIAMGVKTQKQIAEQYGISRSAISDIATGRAWTEVVPEPTEEESTVLRLRADNEHLREERNYYRTQLKMASRESGLFQAVAEEMEQYVRPITALPPLPEVARSNDTIEEHLVIHLSDGHHDQVVRPEECGGLETYNFPVSVARAEKFIATTLRFTRDILSPRYDFHTCTVLAYGDHTSGEIHGAVQRSYFRNQFKNSLAIGQLHALMYRDLAAAFPQVNVVYVPGNHGRRSQKKNYHGAHDNWDFLVAKTAQMYCQDLGNVQVEIPDAFSVNLSIEDVGFNIAHGDDVRTNLGIPWYGLERRRLRLMALNSLLATPTIKYYCCGHFHQPGMSGGNGELILNGPWVATDAYAYESFGGYTEPSQLIHGVTESKGITWRLPVLLKQKTEVPKRYKIDLMKEIA